MVEAFAADSSEGTSKERKFIRTMKKLPVIIFLFLLVTALCSSIYGYRRTEKYINKDVNNALAMTLKQMPCDVVSVDTIKCYRDFITINEIRDTASIAMRSVRK